MSSTVFSSAKRVLEDLGGRLGIFRIQILQFEYQMQLLKLKFSSVSFGGDLEALTKRICLPKSVNVETILLREEVNQMLSNHCTIRPPFNRAPLCHRSNAAK